MKMLTIDGSKCTDIDMDDCPFADGRIISVIKKYGSVVIAPSGWADNLENNQLIYRLRARCPKRAIKILET